MRTRLLTIIILAALVATVSASPAAAARSCGSTALLQGGRASVTITRGSLSCSQARAIIKLYGSNRATPHGLNGPHSAFYTTYAGGWICGPLEQGGSACWLGGTPRSLSGARDVVWLKLLG
jgi:hypothetical protein